MEDEKERLLKNKNINLYFYILLAVILFLFLFSLMHDIVVNIPYSFGGMKLPVELLFKRYTISPEHFPTSIIDSIIISFSFILSIVIYIHIWLKYLENKKNTALFLSRAALMFMLSEASLFFDKVFTFKLADPFASSMLANFIQRLPFLSLSVGTFFLLIFVIEIFRNGFHDPRNKKMVMIFTIINSTFFVLMSFAIFSVFLGNLPGIVSILFGLTSFILAGFGVISIFIIQARSAFMLMNKAEDKIQRRSIMYVGISGLLLLGMFAFEILKEVFRNLDYPKDTWITPTDVATLISTSLMMLGFLFTYLGWIYPSFAYNKKKK
ncbi:MAG: hypothetical protein ACTSVI_11250 [Promethearchaeota archaeon]